MTAHLLALDGKADIGTPLVTGLFNGAIYGLIGLGIVLLFKSNRIFNFAQAEFGSVAAIATYLGLKGRLFGISWHMPYLVAVVVGVLLGTLTAMLTERLVVRPLFHRPKVILVVGTVGVLLALIAVESLVFPQGGILPAFNEPKGVAPGLADPAFTPPISNVGVTWEQVLIMVVLVLLALASVAFFRYSRQGTAILAVSQEPTAAEVVGISPSRISLLTWTIAGFLGSVAGILSVSGSLVGPGVLTGTALVGSITAGVLGGITSLPGAFLGGILVGLIQSFAGHVTQSTSFPGAQAVATGVVLLVVLLIRPRGLLGKEA